MKKIIKLTALVFCFTLIYIVSPLDMVPIIPVDDIIIGILGGISSLALSIIGAKKNKQTNDIIEYEDKTSICQICGKEANGYNLCKKCYIKEKDKKRRKYKTKDGTWVNSKAEVFVYDHLLDKGYDFNYEEELYLPDENNQTILLHPDFCIHKDEQKIYIEYWGYSKKKKDYTITKEAKLHLYNLNKITLINFYEETDAPNLREIMDERLANYEINKINY